MNWSVLLAAMAPEILLLAGLVVLILIDTVMARPRGLLAVSVAAVIAATVAAAALAAIGHAAAPFPGHYSVDSSSYAAKAIVLVLALPALLLGRDEFRGGPFYSLLLSSLVGTTLILSADSFLTLFLGLELMSIPVYVLVLLAMQRVEATEAALKYLILGGTATAMLLMGVSLMFGYTGALSLDAFGRLLDTGNPMAQAAVVLILLAFFLKAAIVPFHTWAPDAYEAATVPVAGFMSTVIKAGVLLAAVRLFGVNSLSGRLVELLAILSLASIVWGNLAAIRQTSFRRMIAYSSIAHAGYLFYAFLGDSEGRFEAVAFYVLVYGLMNMLAFAALPAAGDDVERDRLENLRGYFQRAPFAALMIAVAMFSLAGIPPLPGFVAKFLIFRNVIEAGYTLYAVLGLVGSYLGIYIYLRVLQYMFMSPEPAGLKPQPQATLALGAIAVCLVPAVILMVYPGGLLRGL
ncbi:MAG: NADH-quinone oxidoreductase subunit N [Burkholderiaceae bacterium]|jgi:NADH-quinone oxidoreductase subunit N|nr:NADH-quinone oxidoreductase subunit N [Burkholderiaceae bacterium]